MSDQITAQNAVEARGDVAHSDESARIYGIFYGAGCYATPDEAHRMVRTMFLLERLLHAELDTFEMGEACRAVLECTSLEEAEASVSKWLE